MSSYDKIHHPESRDWLHELARSEINGDVRQALDIENNSLEDLIEEKTISFISSLRQSLAEYTKVFNAYSEGSKHFAEVKIYRVADTAVDFMLYRNQIKLLFSMPRSGLVRISFVQHHRSAMAVNEKISELKKPDEKSYDICAEVGPFREVYFHYQGHRIVPQQVSRFYFAEFVKSTRHKSSSSVDRDVLLNQIKSLLQEKGLDL